MSVCVPCKRFLGNCYLSGEVIVEFNNDDGNNCSSKVQNLQLSGNWLLNFEAAVALDVGFTVDDPSLFLCVCVPRCQCVCVPRCMCACLCVCVSAPVSVFVCNLCVCGVCVSLASVSSETVTYPVIGFLNLIMVIVIIALLKHDT